MWNTREVMTMAAVLLRLLPDAQHLVELGEVHGSLESFIQRLQVVPNA